MENKIINFTLSPKDFKAGEIKRIDLPEIAYLDYKSALTKLNDDSMKSFKSAFELANESSKKLTSKGTNDKYVETIARISNSEYPIDIKTIAKNMVCDGLKEYRIPYLSVMSIEFVPTLKDGKVENVSMLLVESQKTINFIDGKTEIITTQGKEVYLTDIDFENGIVQIDNLKLLKLIKDSKYNEQDTTGTANKKTNDKMLKIDTLLHSNFELLASSKKINTLNNLTDAKIVSMVDDMIERVRNSEKVASIRANSI
ncbi:MAG: hypothetical protein ACRCX7_11540 [Cetobacterium sp.]|uniref:hypothetical protein n=1 Tax=Cetobacterium sp. TaxID=2071632 RepID=UPI003F2C311F